MLDNGDFYDPATRGPIYDYAPKHKSETKCPPYYVSDSDPATVGDPDYDPAANYQAYQHLRAVNLGINKRYTSRRWTT